MGYQEIPKQLHRHQKAAALLLSDPLAAFLASGQPDDVLPMIRHFFAGALNASCAHRRWVEMANLSGHPDEAFGAFAARLRALLDSWRPLAPDAIAWCRANPELYGSVIAAQLQRRTAIALPDALTQHSQRAGGTEPRLIVLSKIYAQSSYSGAATVAASILFGDFIGEDPGSIRFCAREGCRRPFRPNRSDKVFHDPACARTVSANRAHENDSRAENRDKLLTYAQRLASWMRRPEGDWLDRLEPDRRKRKLLSICALAAQPDGDAARQTVLERCFDVGRISAREQGEIDRFISEVRRAAELQKRRS
jgi:hypothetical protein